jgi:glycosyltransferase involved in cell wall biosynthesis
MATPELNTSGTPAILLIAFKFPPYEGVGGNRWMNLANEFARFGCTVHVVTVRWHAQQGSPWAPCAPENNVHLHVIRSGFPHNLLHARPRNRAFNFFRKVLLSRYVLRRFWWDDEAQHWGRHLTSCCERLAGQIRFDAMIATGHPFEANYHAAVVSRKLRLPLIQDLRDPWIDNPYAKYTRRQKQLLLPRVRTVLQDCDRVVAVTQGLLDVYGRYSDVKTKGVVIRNGHGMGGTASTNPARPELRLDELDRIRFVYLGNISNGRDQPFEWLMSSLEDLRRQHSGDTRLEVYSLQWKSLEGRYERYIRSGSLVVCRPVAYSEIAGLLGTYHAAIHLTAKPFPYAASTKIYEYAAAKIPTISLNYGGEAEQLVKELDCGVSVNLLEPGGDHAFEDAIARLQRPFAYRVEKFHWSVLARRYLDVVNNVLAERASAV